MGKCCMYKIRGFHKYSPRTNEIPKAGESALIQGMRFYIKKNNHRSAAYLIALRFLYGSATSSRLFTTNFVGNKFFIERAILDQYRLPQQAINIIQISGRYIAIAAFPLFIALPFKQNHFTSNQGSCTEKAAASSICQLPGISRSESIVTIDCRQPHRMLR